jgi:hypothetical protein
MEPEDGPQRRGVRLLPLGVFALGVVAVLGAAFAAPLVLTGPRVTPTESHASVPPPVRTATAPRTDEAQRLAARAATHVDATWLLVVGALIVAAVVTWILVRLLLGRRRRARPVTIGGLTVSDLAADPSVEVGLAHLRRGLQRALDVLDAGRDPTDAVTQAWLGLQEAAEDAGFRRGSAETPTEFTSRILRQLDVDEGALAVLRRLYVGVRFGGRSATAADVDDARAALRILERQWSAAGSTA